jgi:hypothetical protein
MNFDIESKTYAINLGAFKDENNLSSIVDVKVSNSDVIKSYLGLVSDTEEIRVDALSEGVSEITILATKKDGKKVSYTYIANVTNKNHIINKSMTLQKGWNLISLPVDINIANKDITLYFGFDVNLIWGYDNGKWSAYSPNNSIQKLIDKSALIDRLTDIKANKGYWIFMNKESNSNFSGIVSTNIDYTHLDRGWHLLGSQDILNVKEMIKDNNISIIWKYSNNSWKAISSDENINNKIKEHYSLIDSIGNDEGFWILKE